MKRSRRRWVLLSLALLTVGLWFVPTLIHHWSIARHPPMIGDGELAFASMPPGPVPAGERGAFSPVEARVYALLGQVADGILPALPVLDDDAAIACIRMRKVLERQRLVPGENRPTVTPEGTFSIPARQTPAVSTTDSRKAGTSPVPPAHGGTNTTPVAAVAATSVQRELDFVAQPGSVTRTPEGQVISGRGVWAAMRAEPGINLPLRILDHGDGGYVIALSGPDFATVRVNGGLVVPGRFYQIQGMVEISAEAPVNVHIRPLNAVPNYHPEPAITPPTANG